MNVLIIGGCGYIGSRLYLHLNERYCVETIDLEWFGNCVNPKNHKKDFIEALDFVSEFETVILLAGHSSVAMCRDRKSSFRNNVVNFVELLDSLNKKAKLIYASSSSVYGNTKELSVAEDWRCYKPTENYDLQKLEIDYYSDLSNVEYYGLRFGTVGGWSPNLRTDIMLNKMCEAAQLHSKIDIFNKTFYRPILGLSDLCRGIEAIIEGGDHRGLYNMASFATTVEDIANQIADMIPGVDIKDHGSSPTYDFSISTSKFENVYDFEFQETVPSIVDSLIDGWNNCNKGVRVEHQK